jgi:hypothetical protein
VNSRSEDAEARPASSAELSLDISRVVSQVLNGGGVDVARTGEELAARYHNLGMSGAMIEEAISRAAGMVGMIRGAETAEPAIPAEADGLSLPDAPDAGGPAGQPLSSNGSHHDPIEAEFGALIFGPMAESATRANGNAAGPSSPALAIDNDARNRRSGSLTKGAVAVLRRAFFRG